MSTTFKEIIIGVTHDVIKQTKKYAELVNVDTGEIETLILTDLKENLIRSLEEEKRRKNHFEKEKILEEKRRKAHLLSETDIRGEFFMQGSGINKRNVFSEKQKKLKGLTVLEEGYLIKVLSKFYHNSKKQLMKQTDVLGNKEIVLNKHFESELKLSKGRVSQLTKKWFESDAIYKVPGKKGYFVNEEYFKMNTRANGEYIARIYINKLKQVINNIDSLENIDEKEKYACIGLINRLAYKVHHDTYHVCSNPFELILEKGETVSQAILRNPEAIKYFGTRELLRELGDDGKKVFKPTLQFRLQVLLAAGVLISISGKGFVYKMHPDLVSRTFTDGNTEYELSIKADFATTATQAKKVLKEKAEESLERKEKSKDCYEKNSKKGKE